MPRYVVPWKLGAHRTAGIALFRALLSQVRKLPFDESERVSVQNIIRHRFKIRRFEQSFDQLRDSFQAGYEALDLIDACNAGHVEETDKLKDMLSRVPERLKRQPKQSPLLKPAKAKTPQVEAPTRKPSSILDRPVLSLSGVRHIPVLFVTQDIPILRITKSQPESLGRYIRGRRRQRGKRNDKMIEMDLHLETCRFEDAWDAIVKEECGLQDSSEGYVSWTLEVQRTTKQIAGYIALEKAKNIAWTKKLLAVVDRERELAAREENARRTLSKRDNDGTQSRV